MHDIRTEQHSRASNNSGTARSRRVKQRKQNECCLKYAKEYCESTNMTGSGGGLKFERAARHLYSLVAAGMCDESCDQSGPCFHQACKHFPLPPTFVLWTANDTKGAVETSEVTVPFDLHSVIRSAMMRMSHVSSKKS